METEREAASALTGPRQVIDRRPAPLLHNCVDIHTIVASEVRKTSFARVDGRAKPRRRRRCGIPLIVQELSHGRQGDLRGGDKGGLRPRAVATGRGLGKNRAVTVKVAAKGSPRSASLKLGPL